MEEECQAGRLRKENNRKKNKTPIDVNRTRHGQITQDAALAMLRTSDAARSGCHGTWNPTKSFLWAIFIAYIGVLNKLRNTEKEETTELETERSKKM